ncbi:MAG: hypothetical protein ACOC7T_00600 [Planctomycetota bacterium]
MAGGGEERAREALPWEDLGAHPAARAFRESLAELLFRPGSFFRRMARSGGLHEPLTFAVILVGAALLLSFPAALAYFGLTAPEPARVPAEEYVRHLLAPQATGLAVVLLPFAVAAAAGTAVFLGTLFYLPARLFGVRNWEGAVSVWVYSLSGATVPVLLSVGLILAVSTAGYLLGLAVPGSRDFSVPAARWVARISLGLGSLAAAGLGLALTAVGCIRAFDLEAPVGAAAAISGLLAACLALGAGGWLAFRLGAAADLSGVAAALAAVGVFAAAGLAVVALRRGGGGSW